MKDKRSAKTYKSHKMTHKAHFTYVCLFIPLKLDCLTYYINQVIT